MIELVDVSKTYKSKKSKSTKALNNVSLKLENKGMTFILGKSGSGKSTLLNVLGGLDKYDSGDMFILGKSSKSFTQADFDSYRNTYVGFVFQEFNILEDYDVYENIILALQLQQREVNEKEINELLEKLELSDLKKRKVNELSGGQKQRVAIARALIKNPKIILADEPTGNLDSKTGSQVMDLLKEISKEKLVVVVSHDEDYANKYADRIIEIKDGEVARDTKDPKKLDVSDAHYETIKSKLPFMESFKLGIGSLRHKKVKLFFTVLLTVCTLGFLSCTDTLSTFNFDRSHAKLLAEENEQFIQVEKYFVPVYDGKPNYDYKFLITLDDTTQKNIIDKMGSEGYTVYQYNDTEWASDTFPLRGVLHVQSQNMDYNNMYYGNTYVETTQLVVLNDAKSILNYEMLGRLPKENNEIVISNYMADIILKYGIAVHEKVNTNEFMDPYVFKPTSYDEIINSDVTYYFDKDNSVKIVGIVLYDLSKYEVLKDNTLESYSRSTYALYEEFNTVINLLLSKVFVKEDFLTSIKKIDTNRISARFSSKLTVANQESESYSSGDLFILDKDLEYFDGSKWVKNNSLKNNEVIIDIHKLYSYETYDEGFNAYFERNNNQSYDQARKKYLANFVNEHNIIGQKASLKLTLGYGDYVVREFDDLVIVGVIDGDYNSYYSEDLLKDYKFQLLEKVGIMYPMTERKDFENALFLFPYEADVSAKSSYLDSISWVLDFTKALKKIAFYASLVFLVFTIFLISNFMVTSISYRKKEIGVLRALGARSRDVLKILLWEGIGLCVVSGTVASILLVVVTNFMNTYIMAEVSLLITPFIVTIRQFIVIFLVLSIITFISSVIPIKKISRMKPIDAILNK